MQELASVYKRCKVLIVGAGMSGIAAAARLIVAGFSRDDIVVLEASNRIGGRVNTCSFGGHTIDLGAQWVHGERGNIVYELVNKFGMDLLDDSSSSFNDVQCVLSNRTVVDIDVTSKLYMLSEEIRDSINDKSSVENSDGQGANFSYADYFIPRYYKYTNRELPEIPDDLRDGFLEWLHQFHNSIEGSDSWSDTSITSSMHYRECSGNNLINWKKGYQSVIDIICKNYNVDKSTVLGRVEFNKEVKRIVWNDRKGGFQNSRTVIVHCADGSVYLADCVVVTVSLGVLKQNLTSLFQPQLPDSKKNVIKGLGIGTVDKIFVKFPYKWWPDNCRGFSLIWTKYDLKNTDFIQGDNSWIKDIFGFYIVDYAEDTLCGWVVGESAKIMEQQSDDCVLKACDKLFDKFMGDKYHIPKPEAVLRSKWQSNPFVRGSYSFRSIDSDALNVSHAQLAEPLVNDSGKKVVFFAGEATHPYYFSTVHGAIETGYKQAEQVIMSLGPSITEKLSEMMVSSLTTKSDNTVIVIGAGMAGLAATRLLIEHGINDVLLLEGQDRPGGRVQSIPLPYHHELSDVSSTGSSSGVRWLELGAQWLHGQGSQLHGIAESNNLLSDIKSAEGLGPYLKGRGKEIETSLVAEVANEIADILEDCENFWSDNGDVVNTPASVGQYLHDKFNYYLNSCDDPPQIRQSKMDLFDWHVRFQIIDNSCDDLNDLSAKSWGRYKFCGGLDYINFKTGYSSLVNKLVNDLPENVLKLNKRVTNIKYLSSHNSCGKESICRNGYTINSGQSNHITINVDDKSPDESPAVITCDDGTVYRCQHVIVTSSLGYLKRHHLEMFTPKLPDKLIKSIEGIGYAVINKIFLCYSKPWWTKDQYGFQIVWPVEGSDVNEYDNGHEDCNRMKLRPEEMWMRDLSGFDVLPNMDGVLLGWVGRGGAITFEALTETQIGEQCTSLLRYFTGNNNIPLPDRVVRSKWHSNQLICGGYSHLTTKCDLSQRNKTKFSDDCNTIVIDNEKVDDDAKPENLSHPVYVQTRKVNKHPAILLAGEATHEKYFSTTHGAFESGIRQAEQILNFIDSQRQEKTRKNRFTL